MQLRDYQRRALESNRYFWHDKGYTSLVNFLATGLGKSAVIANTAMAGFHPDKSRVLNLVHTQDLVKQLVRTYVNWFPELAKSKFTKFGRPGVGMVMNNHDDIYARYVVGTPQTLGAIGEEVNDRLSRLLNEGEFDLVVVDECHHAVSKSYLNIINACKQANPNLKILGMTATPAREDGLGLHLAFEIMNVRHNILWGIQHGYLCKIRQPLNIYTGVDVGLNGKKGVTEDEEAELAKAIDVQNWSEILYDAYMEKGEGRNAIWFMPSVEHSRAFCEFMNSRGIPTAHIDGEMCVDVDGSTHRDRDDIIRRVHAGEIRCLTNYNVLLEGFDWPACSLVGWSRLTTNEVIITQAIGRGTRLHKDKEDLLILDFAVRGLNLMVSGTLEGHGWREEEQEVDGEETPVETIELSEQEEIDLRDESGEDEVVNGNGVVVKLGTLFRGQQEAWYWDESQIMSLSVAQNHTLVIVPPNYTLSRRLAEGLRNGEKKMEEVPNDERVLEFYGKIVEAHRVFSNFTLWHVEGTVQEREGKKPFVVWNIPPKLMAAEDTLELLFDMAAPIIDEYGDEAFMRKDRSWRRGTRSKNPPQPSDAQLKYLKRLGCKETPHTKGHAAQLITHHIVLPKIEAAIEAARKSAGKYGEVASLMRAS